MLDRALQRWTEAVYALLRVVAGLMFAFHGAQKLFGIYGVPQQAALTQAWFGGIIELTTGTAIAAGFLTSWAAFLASGTMAVAYTQFHWKLATGANLLPTVNKGELALLYSVLFLFVACRGGGRYSIDARRSR